MPRSLIEARDWQKIGSGQVGKLDTAIVNAGGDGLGKSFGQGYDRFRELLIRSEDEIGPNEILRPVGCAHDLGRFTSRKRNRNPERLQKREEYDFHNVNGLNISNGIGQHIYGSAEKGQAR